MSLSSDLIRHAVWLMLHDSKAPHAPARNISERRGLSAAYYALFHHINGSAVATIAPNVPAATNYRIQRWFEHLEMKKVCGRFLKTPLDQPLLDLIGSSASPDLQNVARSFVKLQEARHSADYDLGYNFTSAEARQLVVLALGAMESWDRIATSAEANIFILSLLLWKNWEKERI